MRKIKRYKNQRRVIILRGIKYLLIISALLLALAFVLTTFVFKGDDEEEVVTETTTEIIVLDEPVVEEEDDNIDNKWAMFLVNSNNPLPMDYDSRIETEMVFESWREYFIDSRAAPYFDDMLNAAKEDGIDLLVVSAYRTIEYQQQNFDNSVQDRIDNRGMTYDEAYADTLAEVALPGESEHNAGLAMDIMSEEYTSMDDDGFENTEAFKWLDENAHKYGFILRYPKGKQDVTGIIYEPWHYRFVGVYYANEIKQSGLCLEEYYEEQGWLDANGKATEMLGPWEPEEKEPEVTTAPENTEPKETMPTTPYSEQKVTIIV